ncbi:aldo/keto reductase [Longispora sp. K20-0274]|uniref:aldo/keto reductase n=1 Tax=Longispora sp. K20-0274 TaxID=3088255 RepID=UPI00399A4A98
MKYRELGSTGLKVSVLGLGTSNFGKRLDLAASASVLGAAIDVGINFIDTADMYGKEIPAEEILGRVLLGRRNEVIVATKFGFNRTDGQVRSGLGTRRSVTTAVENSLRRLRTDYIDLYQMHYPDPVTPVEETLDCLTQLQNEGKIRAIGCANFSVDELHRAVEVSRTGGKTEFASVQCEYSLLNREAATQTFPACAELGTAALPYFVLGRGMLTGKYPQGQPAPAGSRLAGRRSGAVLTSRNFEVVVALGRFAAERGLTMLEVALGGVLSYEVVTAALVGATSPVQITELAASVRWKPTAGQLRSLHQAVDSSAPSDTASGG